MRPFGCLVTILNTLDHLGKFDGKAKEGFFIGYSTHSKAFRVFNTKTKIVKENMHITFLENKPNVAGIGPNWMFDIDTLTISMNYQPVFAGNQTNGNAGTKANINAGQAKKDSSKKENEVQDPAKVGDNNNQEKNVRDQEDAPRKQSEQESKRLFGQGQAANTNNSNILNTVSSPVNTVRSSFTTVDPGREKAQKNKFESMFRQDKDANSNRMFTPVSTVRSTYVYLGGSIPVNAATLPNDDVPTDPLMPDLEDNHVVSESVTSLPSIAKSKVKTSETKLKTVSAPIIKDWVFDSEDEDEIKTKSKQIKPSFAKIKFVKSTEYVKYSRKYVNSKKENKVHDPAKVGDNNNQEKNVRDQEDAPRKQSEQESKRLFGQREAANTNNTNILNTVSSPVNTVRSFFTTVDPGRERAQKNKFESMFGQDKDANSNRMFTHVSTVRSTYVYLGGSIPVNAATLPNDDVPTDPLMPDLEDNKVWRLVDLPKGKHAIGTKWFYRNKKDKRGIVVRNKARLVAQGYTQEEGIDYDEWTKSKPKPNKTEHEMEKNGKVKVNQVKAKGDILFLEEFLNDDPSSPPLLLQELKVVEPNKEKSSIDEPPMVKLKDLPPHLEYAFLEGDDKLPVIIAKDLKDE
nr:ribonuclease H-like domain-containing protein [Tanacetum cinerariifolium]